MHCRYCSFGCIFIIIAFWHKYLDKGTPFPISHKGSMWAREGECLQEQEWGKQFRIGSVKETHQCRKWSDRVMIIRAEAGSQEGSEEADE